MPRVGFTVFKRKDGRFCAKYKKGIDGKTGVTKYGYIYGHTAAEVEERYLKTIGDLHRGTFIDSNNQTISHWLENWLINYKRHSIKPSTYESYSFISENYIKPYIGEIKIQILKTDHIQNFINQLIEKDLSTRTAKYAHRVLSMALDQAVRNDILLKNYARNVILPPSKKKEMHILTKEEQRLFLKELEGYSHEYAIMFLLSTGMRVGEMLALQWSDVDFDTNEITINKTLQRIKGQIIVGSPKTNNSKRKIPLLSRSIDILWLLKKRFNENRFEFGKAWNAENYVFTTIFGTPLNKDNINRTIRHACKNANIEPISAHILRHLFSTRALEANMDLKVLQEILGHSSLSVTADIYSHILPNKKREGMDMLEGKLF